MITDSPEYGDVITRDGRPTQQFFLFLDALTRALNETNFTVATVPDATTNEGRIIYVSDETGGATIAFSDGTDWRRAQDRAVIS